ncbi:unnamed protein product [Darwinula stevensoni]|uniref:Uncharacterized protein n=1 Tax=Darwinula stevensoni TaxID=69355 RepID=A0A7R8XE03_9CRUS|nr:unnamed protein product [Darwinula stevensoni]CAG0889084.1 unnamed protein product [Darwinula stevensoni]
MSRGEEAGCRNCKQISFLGRLQSYERKGNLDIRDHLKIYMGADDERPLKETGEEYVALHYPQAYTKAYSLPEGYILHKRKFTELRLESLKKEKDVTLPPDQLSVAIVFDRVKGALQGLPSLTVQDYAFDDTLLKGMNEKLKNKFFLEFGVSKDDIKSGDHDVFGTAVSGCNILGIFFQIKAVTSKTSQRGIFNSIRKATEQVEKDFNIFRTLCGEFLNPTVKLAGFVALPMLSKMELQKLIECSDCRMRILVSEDVDHPESFRTFLARHNIVLEKPFDSNSECPVMKTFKDIFDLYVSAASALDLPRNPHQLYNTSEEQMKEMTVLLTPQQRKLAKSESRVIFLAGGSGTGKTFVLKRRALKLQERGEVLLINVAGGLLTEEFRYAFEGKDGITVIDGREKEFEKDPEKFKNFLVEMGKGKHVLVDESSKGVSQTISTLHAIHYYIKRPFFVDGTTPQKFCYGMGSPHSLAGDSGSLSLDFSNTIPCFFKNREKLSEESRSSEIFAKCVPENIDVSFDSPHAYLMSFDDFVQLHLHVIWPFTNGEREGLDTLFFNHLCP